MFIFELCLSDNLKWIFRISSLLKTDFRSLVTHFRYGCPYELLVRVNLSITLWVGPSGASIVAIEPSVLVLWLEPSNGLDPLFGHL